MTLGAISPSVNRNRFLVSEDLQQLILDANPGRVKFTASQRLNTQLVLDEFVLKKKKGPNMRQVRSLPCSAKFKSLGFFSFGCITVGWQQRAASFCLHLFSNVFGTGDVNHMVEMAPPVFPNY